MRLRGPDDPRRPLLALLARYEGVFPHEAAVAARIRRLVQTRRDCFARTCRPGHVTGSAWVLSADRTKALLLRHKKLGKWLQPGGHADDDPDVLRVAIREAEEESGLVGLRLLGTPAPLDLDVHAIPERRNAAGELIEDAHEHHDVRWLLVAPGAARPVASDESHEVRWCTAAEIRRLTNEASVLRMLRKAGPS